MDLTICSNGQRSDYTGGRNEETIVNWIKKKTGPPSSEITGEQLAIKKLSVKKAVVYIGPQDSELFAIHKAVAKNPAVADVFEFYHTSDAVGADYGLTEAGIVVLRNFDENLLTYSGEATEAALTDFVKSKVTPRLINFDEDSIDPIFGKKAPAIFLFSNESGKDYQKVFEDAANQLQGKILFVKSTTTDGIQSKLADYIGVDASSQPTIRVIRFGSDDVEKYRYEGKLSELTVESLGQFIDEFKTNKLKPFLKSEAVPENNNGPVTVVVGNNWQDVVADPTKDVLVKYYAPWCGHCKTLAPIWTELGQYVEGLDDVVIAKMDSTANEVAGVAIKSYPTLIWYPKDNKKGVAYSGGRELNDFKEFLSANSASYKSWESGKADAASGVQEEL